MFDDDVWRDMPLGPVPSLVLAAVVAAAAMYVAVFRSRATRAVAVAMLAASVMIVLAYTARGALSNDAGGFSWRLGESIRAELDNINRSLGLLNVFGNVAMFMPIGWFVAVLSNRRPVVLGSFCALLLSASVEVWQMFSGSAGDVDDLLLNGLGGVLGAGTAALLGLLRARPNARGSEAESRNALI
ncbi:MAG: VanZ family protein [Nocardioidaceae bacterium]